MDVYWKIAVEERWECTESAQSTQPTTMLMDNVGDPGRASVDSCKLSDQVRLQVRAWIRTGHGFRSGLGLGLGSGLVLLH